MFENVEEVRKNPRGVDSKGQEFHYYYNREERIKNAPEIVQDYYNGKFQWNKGVKVLVKNRGSRTILISLLVLTAFSFIFTRGDRNKNNAKINGVQAELLSYTTEDEVFTTVRLKQNKEKLKAVPVSITLKAYSEDQVIDIQNKTFEFLEESENVRFKLTNFEVTKIETEVYAGEKSAVLYVNIK